SIVLWIIHALILSGVRQAALVNLVTTIAKIAPIVLFIAVVALAFRANIFTLDFTGAATKGLGSVLTQVKSTMLVTLWVFIGIEGASVVSGRAERRRDIGAATIAGFLITLALYALVSVLSLGIMSQSNLAALKNPSMAGVLAHVVGPWGAALIDIALTISVFGAFLSWTVLAAEIPFVASRDGTMPRFFGRANAKGSPTLSLWVTNGLVQLFLIITLFANSTYQALFSIASVAILVPYIFSGAYSLKLALAGEAGAQRSDMLIGAVATVYGLWLVYAAGPAYLFMAAILYAPGVIFYLWARGEQKARLFHPFEALLAVLLIAAGVAAAWLMYTGAINPLS
ncbi:MAG TPA: amino acid permease, partial [Acetobacteraceae bacterium]|nr:amino acid permease [Acetobacteraceae bacterium]